MAAAAVAPTTADTKFLPSQKKDVQAELVYWKRLEGRSKTIDFTTPGGEQRFAELEKLDEKRQVLISDIRGEESNYTLDKNGFQYVHHDVPELDDWSDEEKVKRILIPKTEELVRKVTGATKTITFANRIRCFAADESKRADSRAPAHSVHSDFTITGALHHLESVIKDPAEVESLSRGRVLLINVWRPLKTIQKDPLAVCDWASVDPSDDWIANRMIFPHDWNELGKIAFSEKHKWHYLGGQLPQEPVIFKQFDSSKTENGGFTVAHSAFEDPAFVDCQPRESIEIKMFAFVPEDRA